MKKKPLLHDHADFFDIVSAVSRKLEIRPQLVEKDYWLMHCLWAMQTLGLKFELKGGTALSKGWGLINRFSEDVDIKIFPPEGMKVATGKNHDKPRHRESRAKYFGWLFDILRIPGAKYVQRDYEFDDHDLRNAGFRIGYKSRFDELPILKTDVLLEVGFDVTTPNEPKSISSWVYNAAAAGGLEIEDNQAVGVPCYLPEYTLVEKLSAISKKYSQELAGKRVKNFTRHYYDIYQLLGQERVQQFIGSAAYRAHKEARLSKVDNTDIKANPAFSMPDENIRRQFAERLAASSGLYYRTPPTLDEILARIQASLARL